MTVDNSSGDYTIGGGGGIAGTGGLTKSGSGQLTLGTFNSFTGPVTLNAGILSISSDGNLGAVPTVVTPGQLALKGGTLRATTSFTLDPNRGTTLGPNSGSGTATIDVPNNTDTLTAAGIVADNGAGTGGLVKTGSGTLAIGVVQIVAATAVTANTYSGGTTISAGTVKIGNFGALGTGNVTVSSGGTLDLSGVGVSATTAGFGARVVTISGTGVGGLGAIYSNSTFRQQNAFSKITLAGNATIGGVGQINTGNGGYDIRANNPTLDLAGFTLTKTGNNLVSLVAATVTNGDIVVASGADVSTRTVLSFETTTSIPAALKPDNITPYTITFNNFSDLNMFNLSSTTLTRQMVMNGDVLISNSSSTTSTLAAPITLSSGGTLTMDAAVTSATNGSIALSGNITGAGGIIKQNATTSNTGSPTADLLLSGSNSYGGGSTINNGSVTAGSDTALGTGAVGVASAGTLNVNARTLGISAVE